MDKVHLSRQAVVNDPRLHIDSALWFKLIQDKGTPMTEEEREEYKQSGKKKTKLKTRNITFAQTFYPDLYKLAKLVHDKVYNQKEATFKKLTKNYTMNIHNIGKQMAFLRRNSTRADIHSSGGDASFNQFANSPEYDHCDSFFFLSQATLLEWIHDRYAESFSDMMKDTVDDKIRMAGIIFTDPTMRDYIPDLTCKSKGGNRGALDASNPRRLAALQLLQMKFIDAEVIISLLPKWTDGSTRESIDNFRGQGTFDLYGRFNPNNQERMKLPWTRESITAIYTKFHSEYSESMRSYTAGTGGGPGDDANYAAWQQRDESNVVRYSAQDANIYLSHVHMWDKLYGYPYVEPTDSLPDNCKIDDNLDVSDSGVATSPAVDTEEAKVLKAFDGVQSAMKETALTNRELLECLRGTGEGTPDQVYRKASQRDELVLKIEKTNTLLADYTNVVCNLKELKRDAMNQRKRSKVDSLVQEIMNKKRMINTIKTTLAQQEKELDKINKEIDDSGTFDDVSSESGMESDA